MNHLRTVKFRSHAITTGTPNAFRCRVLIGCYRLLNAETTNHAQPLIERVPKSHGGLVLTPVVLILLLVFFAAVLILLFFFTRCCSNPYFYGKIRTPIFYINSRTKYRKNVLVGMSVLGTHGILITKNVEKG